jgi:tripartite-type tricarboxylate transporter receptor subunit TctC
VAWGAGGGTAGIVRKISSIAEKPLGKAIYVENIEGGLSATGVMDVMKARPDGYNLASLNV